MADNKSGSDNINPANDYAVGDVEDAGFDSKEEFEVFKKNIDGVDFRLVGWVRASVIFLKGMTIFIIHFGLR
jgi:hypothetical protein